MALLFEQELDLLLLFSLCLKFRFYALLDQLKHDSTELDKLLVHDIEALHLHVCVCLVCLCMLQLLYLFSCSLRR